MIKTDTLIIGAGPVGLFCVHQLGIIGLKCEVVDNLDKIPKAEEAEVDMIDMAYEPKKNSRLSCQLIVSDELEGLTVTTPAQQS